MAEQTIVKSRKPIKTPKEGKRIPCLVVVQGHGIGEVLRIEGASVIIGRSDSAQIQLMDEGVSRQHARIDRHDDGYSLTDLDSTNGTFVNGEQIRQASLRDGDKVQIGEALFRFAFHDTVDVKYQEDLRSLAMRDGLTKIFNRRYFLEMLQREHGYCLRQRLPMTLLLLDLDHFKVVNDTHGHPAGDAVLKNIAAIVTKEVRGYDLFARYGGEEFAVLLRSTALENALIFAERVRNSIATTPVEFEGKKISVTVSIGMASLNPDRATSTEDLIKEADRFLYAAKEGGRNKVCSARSA